MTFLYKITVRILISLLFAVYSILLFKTFFSLNNLTLSFIGAILFAVCYFYIGYIITNLYKKIAFKETALVSAVLAILLMVASPRILQGNKQPALGYVKVTALGIKNDSAHATEVWITGITEGQSAITLRKISVAEKWEKKNNQLVSYKKQPATQEIMITNPGTYQIEFLKHAWSGKVKVEDGKNSTIIDLYGQAPQNKYTYVSNSFIPLKSHNNKLYRYSFILLSFLTLSIFSFIWLAYTKLNKDYFLPLIPLTLFLFFLTDYFPVTLSGKLLAVGTCIAAYYAARKISVKDYINSFTAKEKAFFLLITLYGGFAFVGHELFLASYPVKHLLSKFAYFILFTGWIAFISIAFLGTTELVKNRITAINASTNTLLQNQSARKLYFTFFGIMVACWSIYFIAFFPANMSADSLDQWAQATGIIALNNWHPVFHTLFNRLCIIIYKSPASIALAQIFFMGGVMAGFLLFLYQKGIPAKWLKWAALLCGLIPGNGIMAVTLWKDVPFSIALLWLTLVLAKVVTKEAYFKNKAAYVEVVLALIAAGLFRHNGIPVYIIAVVGLLFYYFKTRKTAILLCISISVLLMAGYFMYISSPARVVQNPTAVKLVAPIHGVAAVNYYNGDLDTETIQEMQSLLPDSIWRSHYLPFSADDYLFFTNRPFVQRLSKWSTSKTLLLYLKTLAKNPYLVIRDRLNGAEMVWNVIEASGSFNFRFAYEVESNKFGFVSTPDPVEDVLEQSMISSAEIADPFLWRAGIYNFLLLLLLLVMAKRKKRYLLFFIPVLATNFSLLLSMTLQNFRYVYYVPMIFGFMWLLSISDLMGKKVKQIN
jgi:hypothetical protein